MKQDAPKQSPMGVMWPYIAVAAGVALIVAWAVTSDPTNGAVGISFIILGGVRLFLRQQESTRAKHAAEAEAAARKAEAAAKLAEEAEEKRQAEEEERQFQAEQAAMTETQAYQRLHMQVNELLDYAHRMKRGGDNKVALQATMEVIGRIASQHDLENKFFAHEAIAADVRLLFDQLKSAGLQNDMVYQRATRVLRYQPPEGSTLRAVG